MNTPRENARAILAEARKAGRKALNESEAKAVLREYGLAVPLGVTLPLGASANERLSALRPPFAVKVVSAAILHKSDVGGVKVGVAGGELNRTIGEMEARISAAGLPVEGWLVEEMAPKGVEVVIGGSVDHRFGPCVMVGLGGVLVELIADVSFRICPIDRRDAVEMLEELRGVKLLRGWRGAPPVDEEAVIRALLRVGGEHGLLMSLADVVGELDINPLIVSADGAIAADARIIIRENSL